MLSSGVVIWALPVLRVRRHSARRPATQMPVPNAGPGWHQAWMRRIGEPWLRGRPYRDRMGVYAIVTGADGMVLVVDERGELQLPGGGIDPGESPIRALHREVIEETGWRIAAPRRIGAYQRFVWLPDYGYWARKSQLIFTARAVQPGTSRSGCRRATPPADWVSRATASWCAARCDWAPSRIGCDRGGEPSVAAGTGAIAKPFRGCAAPSANQLHANGDTRRCGGGRRAVSLQDAQRTSHFGESRPRISPYGCIFLMVFLESFIFSGPLAPLRHISARRPVQRKLSPGERLRPGAKMGAGHEIDPPAFL